MNNPFTALKNFSPFHFISLYIFPLFIFFIEQSAQEDIWYEVGGGHMGLEAITS
jgi:hypothetical protein